MKQLGFVCLFLSIISLLDLGLFYYFLYDIPSFYPILIFAFIFLLNIISLSLTKFWTIQSYKQTEIVDNIEYYNSPVVNKIIFKINFLLILLLFLLMLYIDYKAYKIIFIEGIFNGTYTSYFVINCMFTFTTLTILSLFFFFQRISRKIDN